MFKIPGHEITLSQAAILLDDGLFRGVPSWGRTEQYIRPKYILNPLPGDIQLHHSIEWLLNGGEIHVSDQTASEYKDTIYLLDMKGIARGLDLLKENHVSFYRVMNHLFTAGLDKATDLTLYGNYVIQLAIFGEVKYT